MCGIAGYQGKTPLPRENIERCLETMRRRGPDHRESKSWVSKSGVHTTLLHSRLSIIDLDPRSRQPLNVDRQWIVFNGELYNYIERKADLLKKRVALKTEGDTEIMLASIGQFGWEVLDQCEGMWAFAVYDEASEALTLCRDRFGEKPLYIFEDATGIYFASEIKMIAAMTGKKPEVDHDHLWRYLVNGYKALYKTKQLFFKGVRELKPGHTLQIDAKGKTDVTSYWDPTPGVQNDMSFAEAVAGAKERLVESVKLRLRADVPLAFCMSGGVDSIALISIAKRLFDFDVHGFTIVNTDSRYEEWDMISLAIKELGVKHTAVPLSTNGFLDGLRSLIRYHDAPVYTITYYAQWLLMKSIAEAGYKISISGTAADELFSGYYDHHLAYLQEIHGSALHASSLASWKEHIQPLVRNPYLRDPDLFIKNETFRDHIFLDAEEFAGYLRFEWQEAFAEENYSKNLLRKRMLNELRHESVPVILHEDDLNAMYYSIENRSPFLDRPLYEFCNSIPTRHLIQDGRAKAVLREAVRGIAPNAVIDNRRKVGFNAPVMDFIDVSQKNVRDYLLDNARIYQYVKKEKIENLLGKKDLPNSESKFIFYFVNCKMFLEEFDAVL